MSAFSALASGAAKVVLYCSLLTLGIWLVWYGQYQWGGNDCKTYTPADPAHYRPTAGWVSNTPCAVMWSGPLLRAKLGFLFVVPAAAALASIAVIGLRQGQQADGSRKHSAVALLQTLGCTQLPPRRFWLWVCDGLNVKDAFVIVMWAACNAVWYFRILSSSFEKAGFGGLSLLGVASGMGSLMAPNLVLLLFPVSRGSVISHAIGLSYPEGIRYHRWVGHWVALLTTLHGLLYWLRWAATGRWTTAAWRSGAEYNSTCGGVALLCTILLWTTSQEPVRRRFYYAYKVLHHISFWGFMILGCAHFWPLFWYFVPGLLLYAVDSVFRLHQMFAGRSGSLTAGPPASGAIKPGFTGVNVEVLKVDVCPRGTMCSLLLAAPEFGVAPAGIVWLNVPTVSLLEWHAFDYTASTVNLSADGRVCNGITVGKTAVHGNRKTALSVHIKSYNGWTKSLMSHLAQGGQQQLTVRIQGPYAHPPVTVGQPDGIVIVAGGNGIASALPVFEQLSASGAPTMGLPTLLLWASRKGHEFEFMAGPVLAAVRALGLNLTVQLHITDGPDLADAKRGPTPGLDSTSDIATVKDQNPDQNRSSVAVVLAQASSSSGSSGAEGIKGVAAAGTPPAVAAGVGGSAGAGGCSHRQSLPQPVAELTSLCPVVGFVSFAAQLSFKVLLHLAVFSGFLVGLFIAIYIGGTMPLEAGQMPWPTAQLGPTLVLIPVGCAIALGLITLWTGLFTQRMMRDSNMGPALDRSPAAAIAAMSGCMSKLLPAEGQASSNNQSLEPAACCLEVPTASGAHEVLPVVASLPSVSDVMQKWLGVLKQLPDAAAAAAESAKDPTFHVLPGRLHCVVYACGPTPLVHAAQMAVATIASKQQKCTGGGDSRLVLQFVRKAQML